MPRPGFFAALLEREALKSQILALAASGTSRALLFIGEAGSGKHTAVLAAAEAVLCLQADAEGPCGVCDSCRYLRANSHPDFLSLEPAEDSAAIPVKEVRSFASEASRMLPQLSTMRVFDIDAGALNEQGQNALLKTIEEPPLRCVFLLRVEQADRLLPTLRSRVLELSMPPLSDAALRRIAERKAAETESENAQETVGTRNADAEEMRLRLAAGNPGRYLELAQTDAWVSDEESARKLLLFLARGELGDVLGKQVQELKDQLKGSSERFFYFLRSYGHELLRLRLNLPPEDLTHPAAREALAVMDQRFAPGVERLGEFHALCEDYERKLSRLNAELQLSAFFLKIDEVMHHE